MKNVCQLLTLALQANRYQAVIINQHAEVHLLAIINVIHLSASSASLSVPN